MKTKMWGKNINNIYFLADVVITYDKRHKNFYLVSFTNGINHLMELDDINEYSYRIVSDKLKLGDINTNTRFAELNNIISLFITTL